MPFGHFELGIRVAKLRSERCPNWLCRFEGSKRIKEIERQALGIGHQVTFRYMSISSRLPGSRPEAMPSRPAASSAAGSRYGLTAPSARRSSKPAGLGDADHMRQRLLPV